MDIWSLSIGLDNLTLPPGISLIFSGNRLTDEFFQFPVRGR